MKKAWKKILKLLFVVLVFGLTGWAVFQGQDLQQVIAFIGTADPKYIIPCLVCVLGFVLGESVIIYYLVRILGSRVLLSHCCLYSFIGFFYCCITPSASGGQPMQIVAMRKDGIPVAVSTVVLAIVTILYKLVLVLIGIAVVTIRPARLMACLEGVEPAIYIGLGINVVCIAALLLLVFCPGIVRAVSHWSFYLLRRIRPSLSADAQAQRLERILSQYAGAADFYKHHKLPLFYAFWLTLLQRIFLMFITWFTYKAFGLSGESLWVILTLQAIINLAADMFPAPGGTGLNEALFLTVFRPVFGAALVLPGMVISRGIGYYSQLLICGIMTALAALIIKKPREQ